MSSSRTRHSLAAPLNTMSTGKIIIYRSEGAVGEGHNIPAKPNNGAYTIGREARGGVSLVIAEPHISANQAAIFPPTPEEPTWRIKDSSTNGTSINDVSIGKNCTVRHAPATKLHAFLSTFFPTPSAPFLYMLCARRPC